MLIAASLLSMAPGSPAYAAGTNHTVAVGKRPAVACHGSTQIFAVFEGHENGAKLTDIFFSHSTDGGANWSSPKDISKTPGDSEHPQIAVEKSGAIDVVWTDGSDPKSPDIYFSRSTDGGQTWTASMDISHTPGVSTEPALAIGQNDSIHVVWSDTSKGEKNRDIYYVCSKDGGKTWAKDPLLPAVDISNTSGISSEPTIAVGSEGIVHVAWADTTSGEAHPDIYYARYENGSWSKAIDVSKSVNISTHPTIACEKEKVFLAWSDNSRKVQAPDIWLDLGGKSGKFSKPINISNTPGVSSDPIATAFNGQFALVWSDTSTGSKTPCIYTRISPDAGGDFTSVINVSNTHDAAKHPHATIAGGKMFVIWEDVAGDQSTIKLTSMDLKGLATGPALDVDPSIRGVSGNMH